MNAVRVPAIGIVGTGFYTGLATAARLLAALVIMKLVAWFAGPEGVGRLGQFISLMALLAVLAGGGIKAAIVKYVAEYRDDAQKLSRLLSAALWYSLGASCLLGAVALVLSESLAAWLLGDVGYTSLIRVLAVAQLGIALLNYILAVVNGFMDVRRLAFIQVLGSACAIVLALGLSQWLQLYGVLLALVLGQLACLAVAVLAWWRSPYCERGMLKARPEGEMTRKLALFSVMTITSALLPPLVHIAVRGHLAAELGWTEVGYWQAVSQVSDAYLLFIATAINVYYLPKLAATHGAAALRKELQSAFGYVMPVVLLMAAGIYLARDWITLLLFSAEFAPAQALYGPQLVGDVLKIASFVLSYLMLAKAMTRLFVISELVFAGTYLALVFVLTAYFGLIGAMYAFAINYGLYLLFNLLVARHYLGGAAT